MPVTCTRGWSERLAIPITPRRTPEGRSKKTKEERRDLYRVPHDRLVTDTFAEWQDGGANPALPDSALGQRFGGAETQGHVGQGAPIPPPAHILARRQQYALLPLTDGDASLQGELTETIQEILVEADMVRTGDYGSPRFESSPRSARMGGASVFSAVGALEAGAFGHGSGDAAGLAAADGEPRPDDSDKNIYILYIWYCGLQSRFTHSGNRK